MDEDKARYSIRAVERVLKILASFNAQQPKQSYQEVAQKTNLPPSTVFKLMQILAEASFLEPVSDEGKYAIGVEIFRLGDLYLSTRPLVGVAEPLLEALADQLGMLVSMAVRDGDQMLVLLSKQGASSISLTRRVGTSGPLYLSSIGKALMWDLSGQELQRLFPKLPAPGPTPKSITSLESLHAELDLSRQRGYAIDDEASVVGIYCVGAPIHDRQGRIAAAISVTGVKAAMIDHVPEIAVEICQTAEKISKSLGYQPIREI